VRGAIIGGRAVAGLNPFEAALASEYLGVKTVIPMHYVGNECADNFVKELTVRAPHVKGLIMKPGETSVFKG
jgi:L-ascorbate metabolism protein UlaG (beta-lactamase superfamily)